MNLARPLAACVAVCLLASTTMANVTNDRNYQLGDDAADGAVVGQPVGMNFSGFTADSATDGGAFIDAQDIEAFGGPTYVDVSSRPGTTGSPIGARFDGTNDYLTSLRGAATQGFALNRPDVFWDDLTLFPGGDFPGGAKVVVRQHLNDGADVREFRFSKLHASPPGAGWPPAN